MKKLLILLILLALPFTVAVKAQVQPPMAVAIGHDFGTDNLLTKVGYGFTLKTVYSPDSSVQGHLVMGPSVVYAEPEGAEIEGYGAFAGYDFPLVWKFRTELNASLITLPAVGDNPEWVMVGGALAFAPNDAVRIKGGCDYLRKSSGGSGLWVYGALNIRVGG